MKNLLFFPPYWCPSHPYLSLPCLTAFLKQNNIDVDQIDINIECIYHFLSPEFINKCKNILVYKHKENNANEKICLKDIMLCEYICDNIDYALKILKDKSLFYNIEKYNFASQIIKESFKIISKAYSPTYINLNYVKFTNKLNIKDIKSIIQDKSVNPFIEFYEKFIESLNLKNVSFIGISLIAFEQIIPVLTLCKLIKSKYPTIHIALGGSVLSKNIDKIDNKLSSIFMYADSVLVFEGEYPILQLIRTINNNGDLSDVPNLIYIDRNNNTIVKTKLNGVTDIKTLPTPCFEQLPLEKYLSGERILPYYISRSCYWGKCAFCDHDYGYDGQYRLKDIKKVVKDLAYLKETYNVEYFHIIDEALPPKIINMLCDELIEQELNIKWFNYIRADSKFTDELCKKMKKCGCIEIMIGVESCSEKVLKEMNKGVSLEDIETTLNNMNNNKIWNHVFLINNFPTETINDKFFTITYILKNKEMFHSIGISTFTLGIHSKIMNNLEKYNIDETYDVSDFSNYCSYKSKGKIEDYKDSTQDTISEVFLKNIDSNYFHNKVMMYREHLPLYADKHKIIENKDVLYAFNYNKRVSNKDELFLDNVIYFENGEKLIIYNLKTNKTFVASQNFKMILEFFDNTKRSLDIVKSFLKDNFIEKQQYQIVDFLNKNLILNNSISYASLDL